MLQIQSDQALIFYDKGAKELDNLGIEPAYRLLRLQGVGASRVWALVDCNASFHEPALAFRKGPFFIVEAVSPCPVSSKWTMRVPCKSFFMEPWSFVEVLQV
jgi:hypothetical protein